MDENGRMIYMNIMEIHALIFHWIAVRPSLHEARKGNSEMKKNLILAPTAMLLMSVCVFAQAATATETGTGVTVVKASDQADTYADVYASYMQECGKRGDH